MTPPLSEEEKAEMLEDARSSEVRRRFQDAARACEAWDRAHPVTLEGALDWIDALRALFGDPEVDRRPWRGDDFRL